MNDTENQIKDSKPAADVIGFVPFKNQAGMEFNLYITSIDDAYEKCLKYGAAGWTCGEVPPGGHKFPYDMADKLDFRYIGAVEGEIDGEKGLWYRNEFYKWREAEEETKGQKKGARIWYSRGAKPTDPPNVKEGAIGDKSGYVTLVSFKGKARNITKLFKPGIGKI